MAKFGVHRFRFGDVLPSAIKSIASDSYSSLVAIGREDGDIEIADSSNKWCTVAHIAGQADFELKALVWSAIESEKGRLFGISQKGFIFEVDLASLSFEHVQESYGGVAWSLSASSHKGILAVGCEDGASRIFSYENGGLEFVKAHPTTGSRILSLAYHPVKSELFLGCADGTVRCVEADSGRSKFRITGDLMRGTTTLIWSLIVLSDSTVVTGDNRGHVQLWDGEAGVLMISFHQHTAEVLALAASPDETQVYASGVDSRVTCIQRIRSRSRSGSLLEGGVVDGGAVDERSPASGQWVYTTSHRPHSHDVYALTVCRHTRSFKQNQLRGDDREEREGETSRPKRGAALLSGGIDCKLCVYSISDFAAVRPLWVLPVPAKGITSASASYDLVALKHSRRLDLWALDLDREGGKAGTDNCQLALRVEMQSPEHIQCASLSPNGKYLVSSSKAHTRMWLLQRGGSSGSSLKLQAVKLPEMAKQSCLALTFSGDSSQLALSTSKGTILLLKLQPQMKQGAGDDSSGSGKNSKKKAKQGGGDVEDVEVVVYHVLKHCESVEEKHKEKEISSNRNDLNYAVSCLSLSSDGMYLAVASCTHDVYVYELDRSRLYWMPPTSKRAGSIASLSFRHGDTSSTLVLLYSTGGFSVYNTQDMAVDDWSVEAKKKNLTNAWNSCSGPLQGLCFDSSTPSRMFLHGQGTCIYVDSAAEVPKKPQAVFPTLFNSEEDSNKEGKHGAKKRKRKNSGDIGSATNFSSITSYRSIIHLGCVDGQLVSSLLLLSLCHSFGSIRPCFFTVSTDPS